MPQLLLHLVATERPLINVDATLFINLALWIVLFLILRGLLWGPMIRLISAREGGTEGSRETAHQLEHDARAKEAEYRAKLREARANAAAARDALRADALKREGEILAAARSKVAGVVETQRAEIRRQREALRAEIRTTVPGLASDIAAKVLGREVRT